MVVLSITTHGQNLGDKVRGFYAKQDSIEASKQAQSFAKRQIKLYNITAGDELIKATNHIYLGLGTSLIGGVMVASSSIADGQYQKTLMITGGVVGVIGFVLTIEGISHFKKAGLIMNETGVGIRIPIQ